MGHPLALESKTPPHLPSLARLSCFMLSAAPGRKVWSRAVAQLTVGSSLKFGSRVCSGRGNRKAELALSMREHRCHECGLVMDRDENVARNIENEAARSADLPNECGGSC